MKVPLSGRKKALLIVDVQPSFVNSRNKHVVNNIATLFEKVSYDLYVTAVFHAEKGSLWYKQQGWICPRDNNFYILPQINDLLKDKKSVSIEKITKSIFKGNPDLLKLLKAHCIEEVHIVGFDTNDCVLASAYEAFDLGFFTYIIEECCESSSSSTLHRWALALLRKQNMTNNSVAEKIPLRNI